MSHQRRWKDQKSDGGLFASVPSSIYSKFWGSGRGHGPPAPSPLPPPLVILPHLPSSSITWLSPKPPRLQTAKIITNRQTDKQTSLSHKLKSWRSLTGEGVKLNLLLRTRTSEGISWYFSSILLFNHLDFRISRENGYFSVLEISFHLF